MSVRFRERSIRRSSRVQPVSDRRGCAVDAVDDHGHTAQDLKNWIATMSDHRPSPTARRPLAGFGFACCLMLASTAVHAATPKTALVMAWNIDAISTFQAMTSAVFGVAAW